jgi:hypothetical protein
MKQPRQAVFVVQVECPDCIGQVQVSVEEATPRVSALRAFRHSPTGAYQRRLARQATSAVLTAKRCDDDAGEPN